MEEDVPAVTDSGDSKKRQIDAGKEAAIEAEVKAARERAVIPLEIRMKQFRDMLAEKEVSGGRMSRVGACSEFYTTTKVPAMSLRARRG